MSQPRKISDAMKATLAKFGYHRDPINESAIARAWAECVPPALAKMTRPLEVKRRVLWVGVTAPAVTQELGFLRAQILAKLAELLPEQRITDLRFRSGMRFE